MIVNKLTVGTRRFNTARLETQDVGRIIKTAVQGKKTPAKRTEQAMLRYNIAEHKSKSDEIISLGGFEFSYNMARQIIEHFHG